MTRHVSLVLVTMYLLLLSPTLQQALFTPDRFWAMNNNEYKPSEQWKINPSSTNSSVYQNPLFVWGAWFRCKDDAIPYMVTPESKYKSSQDIRHFDSLDSAVPNLAEAMGLFNFNKRESSDKKVFYKDRIWVFIAFVYEKKSGGTNGFYKINSDPLGFLSNSETHGPFSGGANTYIPGEIMTVGDWSNDSAWPGKERKFIVHSSWTTYAEGRFVWIALDKKNLASNFVNLMLGPLNTTEKLTLLCKLSKKNVWSVVEDITALTSPNKLDRIAWRGFNLKSAPLTGVSQTYKFENVIDASTGRGSSPGQCLLVLLNFKLRHDDPGQPTEPTDVNKLRIGFPSASGTELFSLTVLIQHSDKMICIESTPGNCLAGSIYHGVFTGHLSELEQLFMSLKICHGSSNSYGWYLNVEGKYHINDLSGAMFKLKNITLIPGSYPVAELKHITVRNAQNKANSTGVREELQINLFSIKTYFTGGDLVELYKNSFASGSYVNTIPIESNCLYMTSKRDGQLTRPYCLECVSTHYWSDTSYACMPIDISNCQLQIGLNCIKFDLGTHYYSLTDYVAYPQTTPYEAFQYLVGPPAFPGDAVAPFLLWDKAQDLDETDWPVLNLYKTADMFVCNNPNHEFISTCQCKILNCSTDSNACDLTGCDICVTGFTRYMDPNGVITCETPLKLQYGLNSNLAIPNTHVPCKDPNCVDCTAKFDDCSACTFPTYTTTGTTPTRFCKPACSEANCEICQEADTAMCIKCMPGNDFYPHDSRCRTAGPPCDFGYLRIESAFPSLWDCIQCDLTCLTCYGPEETECQTCPNHLFLRGTTCVVCDEQGQSRDGTNCIDCDPTCKKCSGRLSSQCTECYDDDYLFDNGTCGACPATKYFIGMNGSVSTCCSCHQTCETCFGRAINECLICSPNRILVDGRCILCSDYVQGFLDLTPKCQHCDSSCIGCVGRSTNCKSCAPTYTMLTVQTNPSLIKKCVIQELVLESASFYPSKKEVRFLFKESFSTIGDIARDSEIAIYTGDTSAVGSRLVALGSQGALTSLSEFTRFTEFTVISRTITGKQLAIRLDIEASLKDAKFVIKFNQEKFIKNDDLNLHYKPFYLILNKFSVIVSAADKALEAAGPAATATITVVSTLVAIFTLPQAVILFKVFQTIDYYIFIDSLNPTNFEKFLEIVSKTIMNYMPNWLLPFADDEGAPLPPRFVEFNQDVHIFKNLGSFLTLTLIVAAIKFLFYLISKMSFMKPVAAFGAKIHSSIGIAVAYSLFESFHLDILMSIMLFILYRTGVKSISALQYFVITLISATSLAILSFYIFMLYKVKQLEKAYIKYTILKISEMKDEAFRFLLEDKKMRGTFFQSHFEFLCLMKDLFITVLIVTCYYSPVPQVSLITVCQTVFLLFCLFTPPFEEGWRNLQLRVSQTLYLLLDIAFLVLVLNPNMDLSTKYYFMGYSMIAVVGMLILSNIGISVFVSIRETCQEYKKKREAKAKALRKQQAQRAQEQAEVEESPAQKTMNQKNR